MICYSTTSEDFFLQNQFIISLFNFHTARAKLPRHITKSKRRTGKIFVTWTVLSKNRLHKALITWVNGLRFTATANPPDSSATGKSAVLRKNIGNTIAFITVSYMTSFGRQRLIVNVSPDIKNAVKHTIKAINTIPVNPDATAVE